jgi:uncharacterized membrane protein
VLADPSPEPGDGDRGLFLIADPPRGMVAVDADQTAIDTFRSWLLTGIALTVPLVVTLGAVADTTEADRAEAFHAAIERIPGVGDLYRSFRRMSDIVVDSDTETFQEVKLVEFPNQGSYSLALVTAETPGVIQEPPGSWRCRRCSCRWLRTP